MTLAGILLFLGAALLLYVLLAGADFGAGILELFLGRERRDEQRELVGHAMAPVWEANHVWLVLVVVILFMGFPPVYTTACTYLFLPVMALLVGVVARGCAFTFRHYDTLDTRWYATYSRVFAVASLWTSLALGVVSGALVLGRIAPTAADWYTLYVAPWLNLFCLAMALFTCALFALLAAVYLVGEAPDDALRALFRRRAGIAAGATVAAGAGVFLAAEADGLPLLHAFVATPASLVAFAVATVLLTPFRVAVRAPRGTTATRVLGVLIVTLVMLGWFAVQYPVALRHADGTVLTFADAAAPAATLRALLGALVVGALLIFPSLGYLLGVFKWETFAAERRHP